MFFIWIVNSYFLDRATTCMLIDFVVFFFIFIRGLNKTKIKKNSNNFNRCV